MDQSGYICNPKREISSAGSEHLPYKQRVTGSNPVSPTKYFLKEVQNPVNGFIYRVFLFNSTLNNPKERLSGSKESHSSGYLTDYLFLVFTFEVTE